MKKKSFDQIVTIEIEMELSEYVLCEVTQKCANDVHGNVLCVSMCVCVWIHGTYTTQSLHHNWIETLDPDFCYMMPIT